MEFSAYVTYWFNTFLWDLKDYILQGIGLFHSLHRWFIITSHPLFLYILWKYFVLAHSLYFYYVYQCLWLFEIAALSICEVSWMPGLQDLFEYYNFSWKSITLCLSLLAMAFFSVGLQSMSRSYFHRNSEIRFWWAIVSAILLQQTGIFSKQICPTESQHSFLFQWPPYQGYISWKVRFYLVLWWVLGKNFSEDVVPLPSLFYTSSFPIFWDIFISLWTVRILGTSYLMAC